VPWVVKLGGSLLHSCRLPDWLEALSRAGVVIVPGGGPFADVVRSTQQSWCFDDTTAHRMAITAMVQYGMLLKGLCPALREATERGSLTRLIAAGHSAIWLPDEVRLLRERIPHTWSVTSDSLALWLANHLDYRHLLLIKSATPPQEAKSVTQLVATGLIDEAFPSMMGKDAPAIWLSGPGRFDVLSAGLNEPDLYFTPAIAG
jgi:aspartokinase-like uncharacterized kinase